MSVIHIAFVSRHGVRARMAAALFNSMAEKRRATSRAFSIDDVHRVPGVVEQAMEELDASASTLPAEQLVLPQAGMVVTLGAVLVEVAPELVTRWPALELDGRIETARAVRDDLSSCIVMWVAREGWVDSTERHLRR